MKPYYEDDLITIYHGDCLELLPELAFDVVVTDPPYGIQGTKAPVGYGRTHRTIMGDLTAGLVEWIVDYCSDHDVPLATFSDALAPPFGEPRRQLIWDKQMLGLSGTNLPWLFSHEVCWVYGEGWQGRKRGTVIRCTRMQKPEHPTQKPIELLRNIVGCTPPGIVLDPFMGSGTTLRAAKDLGRKAIGIEIDEAYCEIAAKRMGQEVLDFA